MSGPSAEITRLLKSWAGGDQDALTDLMPLEYRELRRIAAYYLHRETPDSIIEPTVLVHEAYLRLVDQTQTQMNDRSHFFRIVAQVIRHILVDQASGTHPCEPFFKPS